MLTRKYIRHTISKKNGKHIWTRFQKNINISFEEYEEIGVQVDYIVTRIDESIEDIIIKREMIDKLMLSIEMLSEQERLLIYNLFFKGKSERQFSLETGIPLMTINDRKRRILKKLKKLLEK